MFLVVQLKFYLKIINAMLWLLLTNYKCELCVQTVTIFSREQIVL